MEKDESFRKPIKRLLKLALISSLTGSLMLALDMLNTAVLKILVMFMIVRVILVVAIATACLCVAMIIVLTIIDRHKYGKTN